VPAGDRHSPLEEFSTRTSSGRVRGKNASQGQGQPQTNTGSFDSVSGLASESTHSAQDEKAEVMSDLELFRVREGRRAPS
jgi:hypothetical protein